MPNGKTHRRAGAVTGGTVALHRARLQPPLHQLLEAAGGTVGGTIGGALPDLLEPATSPWHRSVSHSWVAGASVASFFENLDRWERTCRARAEHYCRCKSTPGLDPVWRLLYALAELCWRVAAGVAAGLLSGYLSHLALDAMTPRSIPVIA
jgi:hypothetical protein